MNAISTIATFGDLLSGTVIIVLIVIAAAALAILNRKRIKSWFK